MHWPNAVCLANSLVDNGACFRSKHLEYITASMGIALIHSKPYKPQGRGKIERFFLTVRGQFLSGFKGQTLDELNEAFSVWLNHTYHQRKHSATGQTPLSRFTSQMHCLRTSPANLKDYFRKVASKNSQQRPHHHLKRPIIRRTHTSDR